MFTNQLMFIVNFTYIFKAIIISVCSIKVHCALSYTSYEPGLVYRHKVKIHTYQNVYLGVSIYYKYSFFLHLK
jgi:hypothetical protein